MTPEERAAGLNLRCSCLAPLDWEEGWLCPCRVSIAAAIREAVAEEREQIAKMCELAFYADWADVINDGAKLVASIRVRS